MCTKSCNTLKAMKATLMMTLFTTAAAETEIIKQTDKTYIETDWKARADRGDGASMIRPVHSTDLSKEAFRIQKPNRNVKSEAANWQLETWDVKKSSTMKYKANVSSSMCWPLNPGKPGSFHDTDAFATYRNYWVEILILSSQPLLATMSGREDGTCYNFKKQLEFAMTASCIGCTGAYDLYSDNVEVQTQASSKNGWKEVAAFKKKMEEFLNKCREDPQANAFAATTCFKTVDDFKTFFNEKCDEAEGENEMKDLDPFMEMDHWPYLVQAPEVQQAISTNPNFWRFKSVDQLTDPRLKNAKNTSEDVSAVYDTNLHEDYTTVGQKLLDFIFYGIKDKESLDECASYFNAKKELLQCSKTQKEDIQNVFNRIQNQTNALK